MVRNELTVVKPRNRRKPRQRLPRKEGGGDTDIDTHTHTHTTTPSVCKSAFAQNNNTIHLCVNQDLMHNNIKFTSQLEPIIQKPRPLKALGGRNNAGMSMWTFKNHPDKVLIGKHSKRSIVNISASGAKRIDDTLLNEAIHACLLNSCSFSMKYMGVLEPDQNVQKKDTTIAFYSYEGDKSLLRTDPTKLNSMNCLDQLTTFIDDYTTFASLYGMTHNDLHASNLMVTPNGFKLIDYGRMHMHRIPYSPVTQNKTVHRTIRKACQADFLTQSFDVKEWFADKNHHDILDNYDDLCRVDRYFLLLKTEYTIMEGLSNVPVVFLNYLYDMATFALNIFYSICKTYENDLVRIKDFIPLFLEDDGISVNRTFDFEQHPVQYTFLLVYPLLKILNPYLRFVHTYMTITAQSPGVISPIQSNNYLVFQNLRQYSIYPRCFIFSHSDKKTGDFLNYVQNTNTWHYYHLTYDVLRFIRNFGHQYGGRTSRSLSQWSDPIHFTETHHRSLTSKKTDQYESKRKTKSFLNEQLTMSNMLIVNCFGDETSLEDKHIATQQIHKDMKEIDERFASSS
jgi:hypothetical protein